MTTSSSSPLLMAESLRPVDPAKACAARAGVSSDLLRWEQSESCDTDLIIRCE